jgi:Phasin protein
MDSKLHEAMAATESTQQSILELGKERTDAMLSMQKEVLDAYEQASRDWLARVKSEVELWSRLAAKLAGTRSVPDAMQSYQECISQRMRMAADDAQRLSDECGSVIQRVSR